jgi:hypothetical protein
MVSPAFGYTTTTGSGGSGRIVKGMLVLEAETPPTFLAATDQKYNLSQANGPTTTDVSANAPLSMGMSTIEPF